MSLLLVQGTALRLPLQNGCVQCIVTSPPYWNLRDYGVTGQLGLEARHDCNGAFTGQNCGACYLCHMRAVFAECFRVLRPDGVMFVNISDTHRNKQLCGIPQRLALALQSDGWYWRSEIIWCLSGGTWVYARTQKGDMPLMVRDIARLRHETVQLWNGEKWTQLLGMSCNTRTGDEIELVLRSGERISCTPTHRFPTQRGLLTAGEIQIGDVLQRTRLPEPDRPLNPQHLDCDAAWFAGLYVAEGSMSGEKIQIAGHVKEEERWERVQRIAAAYGGSATRTIEGNRMNIRVYGKLLVALLAHLVTGKIGKDKGIAPVLFRYSNAHLSAWLEGYCGGDGSWDVANQRWRLGFTRNYNLERDLRTVCARLGYHLVLNLGHASFDGKQWPIFRGELRTHRSGHHNEKRTEEVVAIQKARCREVYDLGVADEPHVFALASGILTHNSKLNPMPESVTDRPTKAHEQVLLFSKAPRYFWDGEAIKEPTLTRVRSREKGNGESAVDTKMRGYGSHCGTADAGRNARSVWSLASESYSGLHFAVMPQALVERCLKAGSAAQCCPQCRMPWERQTTHISGTHVTRPKAQALADTGVSTNGVSRSSTLSISGRGSAAWAAHGGKTTTLGFAQACPCPPAPPVPSLVLDIFSGAGTVPLVARALGRHAVGVDLSWPYLTLARQRLRLDALDAWAHGAPAPACRTADLPLFAFDTQGD